MKNQSIKPIGKYAVGGASEDSCMEEYTDIDGKKKKRRKKGCGYAASQRYNQRQSKKAKRQEVTKKVLAGVGAAGAATGAYLTNMFGVKDKIKELTGNKTGGAVKKKYQNGGMTPPDDMKLKTRKTLSGGTKTKLINNTKGTVSITKKDKMGNTTKQVTRSQIARPWQEDPNAGLGGGYGYKKGGSTKKYQAGGGASIVAAMKKGGTTRRKK